MNMTARSKLDFWNDNHHFDKNYRLVHYQLARYSTSSVLVRSRKSGSKRERRYRWYTMAATMI